MPTTMVFSVHDSIAFFMVMQHHGNRPSWKVRLVSSRRTEVLINNPMRKVAQCPHYPIDATIQASHTLLDGLVYSLPYVCMLEREASFAAKYKTQPQNLQALTSASRMMYTWEGGVWGRGAGAGEGHWEGD